MNTGYDLQGSTWRSGEGRMVATDVDTSRFSRQRRSGRMIHSYDRGKEMGGYEKIRFNNISRTEKQPSQSGESIQRLTGGTGST